MLSAMAALKREGLKKWFAIIRFLERGQEVVAAPLV
jgi:hypothetical protein